jgi:Holliday junction resolvase RusA-like endonuclease
MHFKLTGEFKPYVRMTRAGKFTNPAAQAYLSSQAALAWQFKQQAGGHAMPAKTPLAVKVFIGSPRPFHHSDLDNAVKALQDSAQLAGVIPNDMWIDSIVAQRGYAPDYCVEFEVFPI